MINLIGCQLHSAGRAFDKSKPTNSLSLALLILTWRCFLFGYLILAFFEKKQMSFWNNKKKTLLNCWALKMADYWVEKQKKMEISQSLDQPRPLTNSIPYPAYVFCLYNTVSFKVPGQTHSGSSKAVFFRKIHRASSSHPAQPLTNRIPYPA